MHVVDAGVTLDLHAGERTVGVEEPHFGREPCRTVTVIVWPMVTRVSL